MGRTVIPVRYEVEAQLDELNRYVKCLRKQDKIYFESIMTEVKRHISSIQYSNPLNPNELMQWSAIIELKKQLEKLKDEVDRL